MFRRAWDSLVRDGGLQLCPVPTLHKLIFFTNFKFELLVCIHKCKTIATFPQLGFLPIFTGPILVTTVEMWIITFKLIRTCEVINKILTWHGIAIHKTCRKQNQYFVHPFFNMFSKPDLMSTQNGLPC